MWWPEISAQIDNFIKNCPYCAAEQVLPKEPFSSTPRVPWAENWYHLNKTSYLIAVDYFSHFPEIVTLTLTRVIQAGLRDIIMNYNDLQYTSSRTVHTVPQNRFSRKSPSFPLPECPGQRIGTDYFHLNKNSYLIAVNYFSHYPEIVTDINQGHPHPSSKNHVYTTWNMRYHHEL